MISVLKNVQGHIFLKSWHLCKQDVKTKLTLTCLFLSSVIRWIWIFFLPMMLCSYKNKRSQSSREVCFKGWERKCSLQPLTSAQKLSDTVIHPRMYARTHFPALMWQCRQLLLLTVSESEAWMLQRCVEFKCGGP